MRERHIERERERESEQPTTNKIEIDTKTARKSISKKCQSRDRQLPND